MQSALLHAQQSGCSVVAVSVDGTLVAMYGLKDLLRPDAKQAVHFLLSVGIEVRILSGDHIESVEQIATAIGLDASTCVDGCPPADKLTRLKAFQQRGHRVAFVGDGSNDAPALAQANVGIAFGSGTDLALSTADVILLQPRTLAVPDTLIIPKRARRTIIANFSWAFVYNVVAVLLAAGAFTPLGGERIPYQRHSLA
ncbi:HAD-like domain-containing protein [Fimicolochytrium jonesii]|uniref:HAD-like domain-containing protein n=1 Tax=Fimicolochytrium jonesii TaxID=1396493 RepID=UPI0022FEE004|nr:HAD-like domain-containing protein [Fimicolochytrium jonesii]KAI8817212.1 HAD-like domain-containing protein [Fimicolochytrium jonesii]